MSKILARCLLGLSTLLPALGTAAGVSIIPAPQHLQPGQGSYRLDAHTRLEAPNDARGREIAAFLREAIRAQTGIAVHEGAAAHGIVLKLDPAVASSVLVTWLTDTVGFLAFLGIATVMLLH